MLVRISNGTDTRAPFALFCSAHAVSNPCVLHVQITHVCHVLQRVLCLLYGVCTADQLLNVIPSRSRSLTLAPRR